MGVAFLLSTAVACFVPDCVVSPALSAQFVVRFYCSLRNLATILVTELSFQWRSSVKQPRKVTLNLLKVSLRKEQMLTTKISTSTLHFTWQPCLGTPTW